MTTTVAAPTKKGQNRWVTFGIKRGRRLLISVWVLITAVFIMIHLIPGDPVRATLGPTAPQELVDALREQMGLNDPLWQQYLTYIGKLFQGDLGHSMSSGIAVSQIVADRLPNTIMLAVPAFIITLSVAIPLGVIMAKITRNGRNQAAETAFTSTAITVAAIPDFIKGIIFVYIFSVTLGVLPVAGKTDFSSFIIPVTALSLGAIMFVSRLVRIDMLKVLNSEYVKAAVSKRLPDRLLYFRHALPNALTTTLTVSGLMLGGMIAGTVLIETVMAWPGMGSTMVDAIINKNLPVIQGVMLIYGLIILLVNLTVDVLIALFDPRAAILES